MVDGSQQSLTTTSPGSFPSCTTDKWPDVEHIVLPWQQHFVLKNVSGWFPVYTFQNENRKMTLPPPDSKQSLNRTWLNNLQVTLGQWTFWSPPKAITYSSDPNDKLIKNKSPLKEAGSLPKQRVQTFWKHSDAGGERGSVGSFKLDRRMKKSVSKPPQCCIIPLRSDRRRDSEKYD